MATQHTGWDAWVATYENEGVHHVGIYDQDGNPWAQRNGILSPGDGARLAAIIKNKDEKVFSEGIMLGGSKWVAIRLEQGESLTLKGTEACKMKTMVIHLGSRCMVVGANKDEQMTGQAIGAKVGQLVKSLGDAGY